MNQSNSGRSTADESPRARRSALRLLAGGVGALFGAVFGIPALAVVIDPTLRGASDRWADAGSLQELKAGTPLRFTYPLAAAWETKTQSGYVVMRDGTPVAYSSRCTHLGCTVRFRDGAFRCPCHGGVFSLEGAPLEGPVTRPLETLPTRVVKGRIQVKT